GTASLSVTDRATLANMAPEYGATMGFFPVDAKTIDYMRATGREEAECALMEGYFRAQGLFGVPRAGEIDYTRSLMLDLATIEPALAGPKRPQDRIALPAMRHEFERLFSAPVSENGFGREAARLDDRFATGREDVDLGHGDVLIAAITSCTNTSNPAVMIAAGLLAQKAAARGLRVKPHIKTSLAPGSRVVTDYLGKAGLLEPLAALGFALAGYGCTTCIGNAGDLAPDFNAAIVEHDLVVAAVLSGNRNFEGRVNPDTRANYLASPMLVVAYAIAGSMKVDLLNDPIGTDAKGKPVYLRDLWPSNKEIHDTVRKCVTATMFKKRYANVFAGDSAWRRIKVAKGLTYEWDRASTYVQLPPYFDNMSKEPGTVADIRGARPLALLGDSITTDHISPAGSIKKDSPAGKYLMDHKVMPVDFNSYGARRGNHEVMMRGTFANIRLKNEMVPGTEGGVTRLMPSGEVMSIYDAAMKYKAQGTPLVIVAGKEYGTGSSRDWAAKGTMLLGVKAVIAESFERIHRSNLVGMGVLPLQFPEGMNRKSLQLDGSELFDITGLAAGLKPRMDVPVVIQRKDGVRHTVSLKCRIDTLDELEYFRHGGILHFVLRNLMKAA
ncbi:MAG: aconitate hydratase AcnA, partial [Alphaproteobacteria bacterium]|nr:aconitate hydratase AcnA [Alphaproteobacteria bacterium]